MNWSRRGLLFLASTGPGGTLGAGGRAVALGRSSCREPFTADGALAVKLLAWFARALGERSGKVGDGYFSHASIIALWLDNHGVALYYYGIKARRAATMALGIIGLELMDRNHENGNYYYDETQNISVFEDTQGDHPVYYAWNGTFDDHDSAEQSETFPDAMEAYNAAIAIANR